MGDCLLLGYSCCSESLQPVTIFLIAERVLIVHLATPALLTLHLFTDLLPIASDRF
jgi:hypothetical protein